MPRVLFHTYHFPPIGGSGAQRPLKMVRYLSDLGYPSLVVTSGGATSDRWAPEDLTLTGEIPADVEIHRVPNADEPPLSTGLRRAAERWVGVPDRWATWWARESHRLGRAVGGDVDLIYVWMQPYASADAGVALSRDLGKPWVADLGDPWALDEMMIFPSALHRRRALEKMRDALSTAAAIVMSTEEAVSRLLARFPELGDRPVVAIPNGFDAADFLERPAPRADAAFRIVHTGYLHTEIGLQHRRRRRMREGLRASPPGLDILTRSHVFLVDALRRLLDREPELAGKIELHLAGVLNASDQAVVEEAPFVRLHGYLTHAESIALMQTADLLFLPMQNLPPGVRATIVPGKTYEYLASRSPILAAVPDGDARDILAAAGNARLVRPDDVDGLATSVREALDAKETGEGRAAPADEVVARYEYSKLAHELADVFDRVLGLTDRARAA
jgi:glycosyltransferase involved in cell wall biosynthesis